MDKCLPVHFSTLDVGEWLVFPRKITLQFLNRRVGFTLYSKNQYTLSRLQAPVQLRRIEEKMESSTHSKSLHCFESNDMFYNPACVGVTLVQPNQDMPCSMLG
jgi:hypothetical protein